MWSIDTQKPQKGESYAHVAVGGESKRHRSRDREWQRHGNIGTLEWAPHKHTDEMVAR